MSENRWIVVPQWGRFQHYGRTRRPIWIKNYNALLHKDDYIDLTLGLRGLLHGLWLAYADSEGRLRRRDLAATLHARARDVHLEALQQAGFIEFSASKPLPLDLNPSNTHAREDRDDVQRQRKAEAWIRNGAAAEVPAGHLAEVLIDEFSIEDPTIVEQLVLRAQEWSR